MSRIIIALIPILLLACSHSIPFNSEVWKKTNRYDFDEDLKTPKQYMLPDVLKKLKKGMHEQEIIEELGKGNFDSPYFKEQGWDFLYCLGPERGFGVDSEWLIIWLNDKGEVQRYDVITD